MSDDDEYKLLEKAAIVKITQASGCSEEFARRMRPLVEASMFSILHPDKSNFDKNYETLKSGDDIPERYEEGTPEEFTEATKDRGKKRAWLYNFGDLKGDFGRYERFMKYGDKFVKTKVLEDALRMATADNWLPDDNKEIEAKKMKIEITRLIIERDLQAGPFQDDRQV